MNPQTLKKIQDQLESEQERLTGLLERTHDHMHRTERLSADFAEQAVETENDEVVEALDRGGQMELQQIKSALNRIFDGSYGKCLDCGAQIQEARLLAIPETAVCIDCAADQQ